MESVQLEHENVTRLVLVSLWAGVEERRRFSNKEKDSFERIDRGAVWGETHMYGSVEVSLFRFTIQKYQKRKYLCSRNVPTSSLVPSIISCVSSRLASTRSILTARCFFVTWNGHIFVLHVRWKGRDGCTASFRQSIMCNISKKKDLTCTVFETSSNCLPTTSQASARPRFVTHIMSEIFQPCKLLREL